MKLCKLLLLVQLLLLAKAIAASMALLALLAPPPLLLLLQEESQQPFFLRCFVLSRLLVSFSGELVPTCCWSACSCCNRCITSLAMDVNTCTQQQQQQQSQTKHASVLPFSSYKPGAI
jgi:hypothetical protein